MTPSMRKLPRWWPLAIFVLSAWIIVVVLLVQARQSQKQPYHRARHHMRLTSAVHIGPAMASAAEAACIAKNIECARALLQVLNQERAADAVPPLTLDWTLNHTDTCGGARGHAHALALTNQIWHTNPSYPGVSWPHDICEPFTSAGQNVGAAWGYAKWDSILTIHTSMMGEQHDAAFCATFDNHSCNILNKQYRAVGIAFAHNQAGGWFVVETFVG